MLGWGHRSQLFGTQTVNLGIAWFIDSSYWNTKLACPEIKCCSLRSLKDPTEERGKIKKLLRGWPRCGLMGTSSPRISLLCFMGQEEAGGALVFIFEPAQCSSPALLCCWAETLHSQISSYCLKHTQCKLQRSGVSLFFSCCLGFFWPPLKRPKRWHKDARHSGAHL